MYFTVQSDIDRKGKRDRTASRKGIGFGLLHSGKSMMIPQQVDNNLNFI